MVRQCATGGIRAWLREGGADAARQGCGCQCSGRRVRQCTVCGINTWSREGAASRHFVTALAILVSRCTATTVLTSLWYVSITRTGCSDALNDIYAHR